MRFHQLHHRRTLALAAAVAAFVSTPGIASAQTKIYPPGTDCANQPTIAERLLCGRQEFRRQQGLSVDQPAPPSVDEPEPFTDPSVPRNDLVLDPGQENRMQPSTASPKH